jgi:hypothetical protein
MLWSMVEVSGIARPEVQRYITTEIKFAFSLSTRSLTHQN